MTYTQVTVSVPGWGSNFTYGTDGKGSVRSHDGTVRLRYYFWSSRTPCDNDIRIIQSNGVPLSICYRLESHPRSHALGRTDYEGIAELIINDMRYRNLLDPNHRVLTHVAGMELIL